MSIIIVSIEFLFFIGLLLLYGLILRFIPTENQP